MIYFIKKINFYIYSISLFTFLEKVNKNRHPSRIAPLSRSFGMTFSIINTWAIANKELSKVVSSFLPATTLCHLRFFFFGYFPFFFVAVQKEKSDKRNSNYTQYMGITK